MNQVADSVAIRLPNLTKIRLAMVMPVYNEGETIKATVSEIEQKVMKRLPASSLLIFEDGSRDNTKEVIQTLANVSARIKIKSSLGRKGYAKAVRDALTSVDENEFDYVLFLDSDGQYDPDDIYKLLAIMMEEAPDIVAGARVNRSEPSYRVALSTGLKLLEKVLFNPTTEDVTSAFRLMKVSVAKEIAAKVKYSPFSFWLEFTARATEEGCSMIEVPVRYRPRSGEAKSNVYSLKKMPKIVSKELIALFHTWWDYKGIEAVKFAGVGLSGAAVILGLTYALTNMFHQNYLLAAGIAIEISILWAFVLNDTLTFRGRRKSKRWYRKLADYNLVSIIGLAINEMILLGLTTEFRIYYLTAEFVAIVLTFGFNYFANLRWTWNRGFRGRSSPEEVDRQRMPQINS